jgi:CheY-specific phosphatase CheX
MQRIFWRHRWLLIVFMLVPIATVIPLREKVTVTYASTASIQAQATAPDAATQVQAILARVSAVATNPALVATAIRAAHVRRNATEVASHDVAVNSVGSSAVVSLTVTDPDRRTAIRLAASIARAVVAQLNGLSSSYATELANLNTQNLALTQERNQLLSQLSSGAAGQTTSPAAQARLESLTAVDNQLVANAQAQQQIQITLGSLASAQIVSLPTTAAGVTRHVAVYAALAGLLGLIVGLLIAAVREVARPTVGQPAAGARELGLILLGNVEVSGGEVTASDPDLPTHLDLAARRLAARTLVLSGPVAPAELAALTEHLNDELRRAVSRPGFIRASEPGIPSLIDYFQDSSDHRGTPSDSRRGASAIGTISPYSASKARSACTVAALPDAMLGAHPEDPALVIVLPRFAPHVSLDRAADLGVTTGWPVLGVVGMQRRRARGWLPRRKPSQRASAARAAQPEPLAAAVSANGDASSAQTSGLGRD